ncbi:MAG: hypothetical protein ACPGLV_06695 [Bacteroidia bacterium]
MRKSFENIELAQPTETRTAASLASNTWEAPEGIEVKNFYSIEDSENSLSMRKMSS